MKFHMVAGIVVASLFMLLGGCNSENNTSIGVDAVLERVILERGHGSAWGSQLYVDVGREKIYQASYFPPATTDGEMASCQDISITREQWESIETVVFRVLPSLEVKKDPGALTRIIRSWFEKATVLDGGAFWNLTLVWQDGQEFRSVEYVWPVDGQAEELEERLESMLQELSFTE